jgi:hypothetical protein
MPTLQKAFVLSTATGWRMCEEAIFCQALELREARPQAQVRRLGHPPKACLSIEIFTGLTLHFRSGREAGAPTV